MQRQIYIDSSAESRPLSKYAEYFLELEESALLRENTLKHHRSVLERFVEVTSVDTIRENGVEAIRLFFANCNARKEMSEFTQKSYFNVIKKFFKFLKEKNVIEEKTFDEVEKVHFLLPDVKPFFFAEEDEEKLFDVMKTKPKNRGGEVFERNVMMLKLMRFGGLRPEEVREVRINYIYDNGRDYYHVPIADISYNEDKIKDISYNEDLLENKEEVEIIVKKELIDKELQVLKTKGYDYLCEVPKSKRRLTGDEMDNASRIMQKRAGIKKPLGMMAYRHTYIKGLFFEGLAIDTIRKKVRLSSRRAVVYYMYALNIKRDEKAKEGDEKNL